MKKIRLTLIASFFICYAFSCLGQQDVRNANLCKVIEKQYTKCRMNCFILEHLDTWYFVSVVNEDYSFNVSPTLRQRISGQSGINEEVFSSISYENAHGFFVRNGIKSYPKCTFSTKGIKNYGELTPIYETLKKNKKTFYDMPFIGTFRASATGYAYVFAKIIIEPNENVKTTITNAGSSNNSADKSNITASNKSVTLVVYGTAESEDEAIKIALRSAIEQAFGTFVSANTQIVNDELTKDEIVSVTSGNIERYSLISSEKDNYGKTSVTVKATVSIGKLLHFAQSKGATTELAGATFAMNMKMRRLNKE